MCQVNPKWMQLDRYDNMFVLLFTDQLFFLKKKRFDETSPVHEKNYGLFPFPRIFHNLFCITAFSIHNAMYYLLQKRQNTFAILEKHQQKPWWFWTEHTGTLLTFINFSFRDFFKSLFQNPDEDGNREQLFGHTVFFEWSYGQLWNRTAHEKK